MENNIYEELESFGYIIQKPNKDKTHYFVKQEIGKTTQIFLKTKGKNQSCAEIEVLSNYKKSNLNNKEMSALESLLSSLGVVQYEFV